MLPAPPPEYSAELVSSTYRLWPLGIAIIFMGSLAGAAGDTMVRMAYSAAGPNPSTKQMLRNPVFAVGLFLTTAVDAGCTLGALTFAPSSMVTPFAGVHIFWAVLLSHFWLRERVGRWEVFGSSLVISGVLLLVLFCGKKADLTNTTQFRAAATSPAAIAYISAAAAAALVLVILSHRLHPCSLRSWESPIQRLALALASGVFGGNTNIAAKFLTIAGTQFFKGDWNVLTDWQSYAVLFATITLALLQLLFLNTALRKFEAIYVIPTTNSCLVAEGIVGAICVLGEEPSKWICFLVGLFLCVSGILVLTIKHKVHPIVPKLAAEPSCRPPVEEVLESHRSWAPSDVVAAAMSDFVPSPTAINTALTMQQLYPPIASRTPSVVQMSVCLEQQQQQPEQAVWGLSTYDVCSPKAASAASDEDKAMDVTVSVSGSSSSYDLPLPQQQQQQAADISESTSDTSNRGSTLTPLPHPDPQQQQQQRQRQRQQQQRWQQQR
ncbi:hypothetical protein Efla_004651 [Eimeria flavescens]